jgi:hypothetical protein
MPKRTIAVDLAKNIFEVAVASPAGAIRERKRLSRPQFERFWDRQLRCRVVLEGCSTSHFWARFLRARGFEVVLLPPHYVKPYRRRSKTDRSDCEAPPRGRSLRRHSPRLHQERGPASPRRAPPGLLPVGGHPHGPDQCHARPAPGVRHRRAYGIEAFPGSPPSAARGPQGPPAPARAPHPSGPVGGGPRLPRGPAPAPLRQALPPPEQDGSLRLRGAPGTCCKTHR